MPGGPARPAPGPPRPRAPPPTPGAPPVPAAPIAAAAPPARVSVRPPQLPPRNPAAARAAGPDRYRRQRRPGTCQPPGGQPVQVPARPADWLPFLPARLDQPTVGEPDQDRVQAARLQPGVLGDPVPVPPFLRLGA